MWKKALQIAGSIAIVAALSLVERKLQVVNATTVALSFVLAVLAAATWWGLTEAVTASVVGMLFFNYFFLPPVGTLTIADPQNWVALAAFLLTAIVASHLSTSARRRALDATRRQFEMEKLYDLSRSLLLLDKAGAPGQVALQIAQVFDLPAVAVFDRTTDRLLSAGAEELAVSDNALRDAALQGTAYEDTAGGVSIMPLMLGGAPIGALAVGRGSMSDTALRAVANLAAITLERGRSQAIALRAEAARQNQELKSTLLDALAHEFKTPLTSIKAAVSGILEAPATPHNELLSIVEEETDRLDALVNEAIQMARVEAGQVQLDRKPLRASDLIADAVRAAGRALQEREVHVEVAPDLPEVLADRQLMLAVMRHLIGNSLKYAAPESPIELRAWTEEGSVAIAVRDRGPGIPAREQERIFERFYRSPRSATAAPGTGMGLAIARDIVEAHGGTLDVRSTPGDGSEFFFKIPVAPAGVRR
ncbi:MAG TPA: ATP-binding protein [Candidatus Acidoferrum sp.]|nr:ATP-binding protein [Candidatus Acidoferrum sp.]